MKDSEIIEALGGPTKLAKKLGLTSKHAPNRVANWKTRGIPARIQLDHPEVFASVKQQSQQ